MRSVRIFPCRTGTRAGLFTAVCLVAQTVSAGSPFEGRVLDLNGRPLEHAMVTSTQPPDREGARAVTVFTGADGSFRLPEHVDGATLNVALLGYEMIEPGPSRHAGESASVVLMRPTANQANVAPASAWLKDVDPADKAALVMNCVACHQMPAPEVRAYAAMVHDLPNVDRAAAREQSWQAIVKYMNYLSAWEFGRGVKGATAPDPHGAYSIGDVEGTTALLSRNMTGPFRQLEGYEHGAPLLANERTVIREYEVPRPNAIREAVTLADPRMVWTADVSTNRIIRVDTESGALREFEVPVNEDMGPHTLVRGADESLWVAPFFNGIVARLDPKTERWQTWKLHTDSGGEVGVHDLTFGSEHDLRADRRGWIWFSDIVNNAVGWFDPKSGRSGIHAVPKVPGRDSNEQLYGIAMSADRKHVWYSQLGIGVFGSFNVETRKFETVVELPDRSSGPRRLAISDRDVLYVPLYGSGQLAEYDTRARKMIGIYDLPDRASAPYAVTWDPRRKVVWIPTSNANAIYRFDPRDKSFAVLPLPREGAFLRMLTVDKSTGALVTSYANIVENVHGPRMALTIELGDEPRASTNRAARRGTEAP